MPTWSRKLGGMFLAAFLAFGLLYVGDALVWQVRLLRGTAYGTVEVHQFLATSLKGDKIEYDMTGTVQEKCARALVPQQGNPACWWLERHKAQWE
ncbi:MAG: hypothetical protein ABSF15_15310 [Candidatus Sulfotelmatobacter sp.]